MNSRKLSEKQILILSMIGEFNEFEKEGLSGTRLNKLIIERKVRRWAKISFSNVYYVLERLESLGLLKWSLNHQKDGGVGAPEKIYFLTRRGKSKLKKIALNLLSGDSLTTLELDLGLAASYVLPPRKVVQALIEHQNKVEERFNLLEEGYKKQGGDKLHYQAWGVINHHRYILRSRIKLFTDLIERIQSSL